MRYVDLPDVRICVELGDTITTVYIHGFGSDLGTWDVIFAEPQINVGALRYDLRGFGQSTSRASVAYSHADDLASLLDACTVSRCDLVGVSMGGAVALNFSLEHPDRVRRLVLLSPSITGWEWSELWTKLWRDIEDEACRGDLLRARELWCRHPLFDSVRCRPEGAAVLESIERFAGQQWITDSHRFLTPDLDRLHGLQPSTLLLTGGLDLPDFRLIADLVEACVPDLRRIVYPAAGHLLHIERPALVAQAIETFLQD